MYLLEYQKLSFSFFPVLKSLDNIKKIEDRMRLFKLVRQSTFKPFFRNGYNVFCLIFKQKKKKRKEKKKRELFETSLA